MKRRRQFLFSVGGHAESLSDRRRSRREHSVWRSALTPIRKPQSSPNRAFTLLEIILSLAILAGSLAALGEAMRSATRSAAKTEDETQAQILAESIINEFQAGSRELTAVNQAQLDTSDDPPWVYSVNIDQTDYDELVAVRVRVEQQLDARLQPAHFELVRWMPNPDFVQSNTSDQQGDASNSTGNSGSATGSVQ
ncbi:MAG TPA: prepilin-type N-terminal cleavage/methylation domain-containing protein [Lacipirellulaceae bacterium]|nr:prepilin-type N-terminal cleavage/methylation domain-containing protein [Lacipirellulaceae bacterium]